MTFVDDSLAGAAPARGGKSGAKGAKQAELTAQKDAFNRAFSEAGKKQQPQISIRDKSVAETQNRIDIQNSNNTDPDVSQLPLAAAGADESSLLEALQGQQDAPVEIGNDPAEERASTTKTARPRQDMKQAREDALFARIGAQIAQTDADAVPTEDAKFAQPDMTRKLADIFKDRQTQIVKTQQTDKPASSQDSPDDQVVQAGAETLSGDVDQLLALLGTAQAASVATETSATNRSELSELQALAERAGKPKLPTKEDQHAIKAGEASHVRAQTADGAMESSMDKSETDQIFRFARADGKGQDVSMAIGKDGATATVDTSGTPTAKAETVTVVEARRYLGLAPSSNAQTVTSTIAGSAEWAQSVQTLTNETTLQQQATGKVVNTLKIQMHPIDLGMVTATLRLKDDELHVDLKVETGDAFRQLSDDQNAMVKALRAQGFAVDQVNIVFNAPDSNSGAQQQQQPQAGGQFGREESAGGDTAQGREQRNDGGNQGDLWTANETTGDVSPSDAGRSGDVYM
ncbi:chemotaxis protein MotD [Pararhizobium capsulatum DSM 1112]|uniref:Chemotaxis protein MotD n=1 Tax=Pararhizobium capsulatum DSM 1112 TaxID=1121113 RepID=A0ABU0BLQ7_9HYPH|nr:flagellar hook-length control protein FliK [Pararhizobium capsulatum]MDQ0319166.1 chemotaxis protein MotD [Pararhizobium capsulatum DSM 1112]